MCILSVFTPGAQVVRDHLENGACSNPDGHGFAVIVGDRIEVGKGMEPDAVIDAFLAVRESHPDSHALFHSRITTDGGTTVDNCHPFVVGGDERTVLAHNGILPGPARPRKGDVRSDTRILAEDLIPRKAVGDVFRARGRKQMQRWATKRYDNKIVLLSVDPRLPDQCYILGEKYGSWVDGVWHSNNSYLDYWRKPGGYLPSWERGASWETGTMRWWETPTLRATDCDLCHSPGSVNPVHRYCHECYSCVDCSEALSDCQCWPGAPTYGNGTPLALEGGNGGNVPSWSVGTNGTDNG